MYYFIILRNTVQSAQKYNNYPQRLTSSVRNSIKSLKSNLHKLSKVINNIRDNVVKKIQLQPNKPDVNGSS